MARCKICDDFCEGQFCLTCQITRRGFTAQEVKNSQTPHDPVTRPSHYTSHPSGIECIQVAETFNFCLGNAVKYIWRAGLKTGSPGLEDLKKARWYLDREISRLECKVDLSGGGA